MEKGFYGRKDEKKRKKKGNKEIIFYVRPLWTPCLSFLELDTYSGQLNEEKRNSIDRDQGGPQCVTDRNGIIERFSRATTMRIESQKSTKQVVQRLVFSSMNTGREIRIDFFFFLDYNIYIYILWIIFKIFLISRLISTNRLSKSM